MTHVEKMSSEMQPFFGTLWFDGGGRRVRIKRKLLPNCFGTSFKLECALKMSLWCPIYVFGKKSASVVKGDVDLTHMSKRCRVRYNLFWHTLV